MHTAAGQVLMKADGSLQFDPMQKAKPSDLNSSPTLQDALQ